MSAQDLVRQIQTAKKFFDTSTACLDESDSQFAPRSGMFTTAQQVAHVAQGIDILIEGAFDPRGFETDVQGQRASVLKTTSLSEARAWLDRAVRDAVEVIGSKRRTTGWGAGVSRDVSRARVVSPPSPAFDTEAAGAAWGGAVVSGWLTMPSWGRSFSRFCVTFLCSVNLQLLPRSSLP